MLNRMGLFANISLTLHVGGWIFEHFQSVIVLWDLTKLQNLSHYCGVTVTRLYA